MLESDFHATACQTISMVNNDFIIYGRNDNLFSVV